MQPISLPNQFEPMNSFLQQSISIPIFKPVPPMMSSSQFQSQYQQPSQNQQQFQYQQPSQQQFQYQQPSQPPSQYQQPSHPPSQFQLQHQIYQQSQNQQSQSVEGNNSTPLVYQHSNHIQSVAQPMRPTFAVSPNEKHIETNQAIQTRQWQLSGPVEILQDHNNNQNNQSVRGISSVPHNSQLYHVQPQGMDGSSFHQFSHTFSEQRDKYEKIKQRFKGPRTQWKSFSNYSHSSQDD